MFLEILRHGGGREGEREEEGREDLYGIFRDCLVEGVLFGHNERGESKLYGDRARQAFREQMQGHFI